MPETFTYDVAQEPARHSPGVLPVADQLSRHGGILRRKRTPHRVALKELGGLPAGFVLATKADRDLNTGDFSGEQIKRSVERSLTLLNLDKIQIMYLHDPEHARFEEIIAPGGAVDVP